MPVEFLCPGCRATLSVARRKIGSGTECPRCSAQLVVPDEGRARTEVAMAKLERTARKRRRSDRRPELNVAAEPTEAENRDDAWSVADMRPHEPASWRVIDDSADDAPPVVIAEPPPVALWRTDPGPAFEVHDEPMSVLLRRRRRDLVAKLALAVTMAALGFVAGYALARSQNAQDAAAEVESGPVLLEGRITYADSSGAKRGDAGAIVLAVPVEPAPAVKLRLLGLESSDGKLADVDTEEFTRVGGAMSRADENGGFTLVVPKAGEFRLLWISRQSFRPENEMPSPSDLDLMREYFASPIDLIGLRQHDLERRRLDANATRLDHTFAADKS